MTEPRNAVSLLRGIQEGTLKPRGLGPDERRDCVEQLYNDGLRPSHIAEILKWSKRTVERDLLAIRVRNAPEPGAESTARFIGGLVLVTERVVATMAQIARDSGQQARDRIEASRVAVEAEAMRFRLLQDIGVLPKAAKEVHADVTHEVLGGSPGELAADLKALRALGPAIGVPDSILNAATDLERELGGNQAGQSTPEATDA